MDNESNLIKRKASYEFNIHIDDPDYSLGIKSS
jgi:hypothetical protein